MKVLISLFLFALFCGNANAGENRLGFGRISLNGNVESVEIDFGPLGITTLTGVDGGRTFAGMTFRIPIPAAGETGALLTPKVTCNGGGEARYLGWDSEPDALSPALRMRSMPPVLRGLPRPTLLSLLLIVLIGSGIVLTRRVGKPLFIGLAVCLGGIGFGVFVAFGQVFVKVDGSVASVVDFAGVVEQPGSWAGIETAGSFEQIDFQLDAHALEVQPAGAALELSAELGDLGAATWSAAGPRASKLWVRRPWTGSSGDWLHAQSGMAQDLGDLQSSWLRSSASEVTAFGPWEAGGARPAGHPELLDPPSWLLAGLPMGREAFLGHFAESETFVRATWIGR